MESKKRMLIMIATVCSIIIGTILYVILAGGFEWHSIILIIIVVMFLVYAIPKFIINRNDVVSDDEFSKRQMRTAAARSYIVSLYTWLAFIWFSKPLEDLFEETSTIIGVGIGVMAIVFLINIIVVRITGTPE
jgi:peptidoglycan/LPS O-acetylase OafA/YrhL